MLCTAQPVEHFLKSYDWHTLFLTAKSQNITQNIPLNQFCFSNLPLY